MQSEGDFLSSFFVNSWKKEYFLITPEEFRDVFSGFHFVVTNTGVKRDYTETWSEKIFQAYALLYDTLKSGRELNYAADWPILHFSTGVTAHLENIYYKPSSRLSVPAFHEPCIDLSLFPLIAFHDKLEKTFGVDQFPNSVCGIRMLFPKAIVYENRSENCSFADAETWDMLLGRIKAITSILKLETSMGFKNTKIRVSSKAKLDLADFHVIQELGAKII